MEPFIAPDQYGSGYAESPWPSGATGRQDTIRRKKMNVLIIKHVEIEGPGLIEACLKQEKIPYRILDLQSSARLPKLDDLTHIALLGGPMNVYEEDHYPFLREEDLFIKEAIQRGKSILGICLGAQLIAKALGTRVFKAPHKEVGWYEVSLTEEGLRDFFFSDFPRRFPVFQWHEDTFDIPKGGKLIAISTSVPHQAFRYGENTYGLQFHLEVTEEMIRAWMQDEEGAKEKIQAATQANVDTYPKRGKAFFTKFFSQSIHPY